MRSLFLACLLGTLTLPLAGCGGRDNKKEFTSVGTTIGSTGATPAPAGEAKKSDGGGAKEAPPGVIVTDLDPTPAAKSDPGVAEPVVGMAKPKAKQKQPEPPSGVLTAGSFDDNLDPLVFKSFLAKMNRNQTFGKLPSLLDGQRVLISVRDAAGQPVGSAKVRLAAGANQGVEALTRSDGRAVFVLSFDQLPENQDLIATVTPPDGGASITETVTARAPRWDVTLPQTKASLPKHLDFSIVFDTTGSMGDELKYLSSEIKNIAASIKAKYPEVQQRYSLILYRDAGDEYVTRVFDFNTSVDDFHKVMSQQKAEGGGDYPEAMHLGLEDAVKLRWRDADAARVMFLIADAPPHAQHAPRTMNAIGALRKRGVAVYPIACSGYDDACELAMRGSAMLTGAQFLFLTDDSGVGGSHAEPKIPYYQVERLEKLMTRMIASELSGQRIDADPKDVIRSVGKKVN